MSYYVNEIFYSLQGEGVRVGTPNLFLRFGKCNMRCAVEPGPKSPGGFDCDTEFESGRMLELNQIVEELQHAMDGASTEWIILTGGEPGLQVDDDLIERLHSEGWRLAMETNGTVVVPDRLDWVTVSPKVAEHAIAQRTASEVKYVRSLGQGIPRTVVQAQHYLISPAAIGNYIPVEVMQWCIQLVKDNPQWRLSPQLHKTWDIR